MRFSDDRGSGTVLILGISAGFVSLAAIFAGTLGVAVNQAQVQAGADLSAIAASQVLRGISTGIPCDQARRLAQLNMTELHSCSIVGEEVTVVTGTDHGGIVLNATATATGG